MSRIKEIPSQWCRNTFKEALDVLKDGTHFSPKVFGGENLYITSKNIRMGRLDLEKVKYIPDDEHQRIYSASPVKYGDVLLTKDGANTGNVCINILNKEFSLLSSVAYLRGKACLLTNEYLFQWLSSPKVQYDLKKDMSGQAITRLTLEKIEKFKILLPPLPEQKAIADLLSTWDEAIKKTERLINAKEKRLTQLLNEMIYQPTKNGKWKEVRTKSLFKERRETKRGDLPLLSITNNEGVIPRDETNRKDTSNEDKSKYLRICSGDIGYNTMRMWQGVSALSTLEGIVLYVSRERNYTLCLWPSCSSHLL